MSPHWVLTSARARALGRVGCLAILGTVLSATGVARAEELGTHQTHFRVDAGVRAGYITNEGFDPFSKNNWLPQMSLGVSRTLFADNALSLAGVFYWDAGAKDSRARGADTELHVYRLTLGPELRYHVLPFAFAFVRVMPGAMFRHATLEDSVINVERQSDEWAFALDTSVGGAVEIWGMQNPDSRKARVWGIAEIGYGYATSTDLSFEVDDDDSDQAPQRLEPVDLGDQAIRGVMFRISAAVSF